jgi:hypothetical protein
MGLLTGLVTLPLAPVGGVSWIVEQVAAEADRQLHDERELRRQLLAVELDYEEGAIDEQQRTEREEELLDRLAQAKARAAAAAREEGAPYG